MDIDKFRFDPFYKVVLYCSVGLFTLFIGTHVLKSDPVIVRGYALAWLEPLVWAVLSVVITAMLVNFREASIQSRRYDLYEFDELLFNYLTKFREENDSSKEVINEFKATQEKKHIQQLAEVKKLIAQFAKGDSDFLASIVADVKLDSEMVKIREALDTKIEFITFRKTSDSRIQDACRFWGVKTLKDLVSKEKKSLPKPRNFGKGSMDVLESELKDRNLSFGMDVEKYYT